MPSSVITEVSDEDGSEDEAITVAHEPQSSEVINALDVLHIGKSAVAVGCFYSFKHPNAYNYS